jgi:hypothetical protein
MKSIERKFDGSPTIFNGILEDGDKLFNTIVGFGTIIIDNEFLNDMETICEKLGKTDNLIYTLTNINIAVHGYFYSKESTNKLPRKIFYDKNKVVDEDGVDIGTKLSSLKGQNVALCSEKSLATYVIYKKLLEKGKVTRIPSLVLSQLKVEGYGNDEPHAFILLNKDCNDPTKHLLFDPENPTTVKETKSGQEERVVGLYSVNDEEYDNLVNGRSCSPTSLYEIIGSYEEISPKRTYGKIEMDKLK